MKTFEEIVRANICGDGYDAEGRAQEIINAHHGMNTCKRADTEPFCTNDELRKEFNDSYSYKDITEGDVLVLIMLLNREYKSANRKHETSSTQHLSRKVIYKKQNDGSLMELYLFVNSTYFTQRECISFNRDGFIGFAGWADERNLNPIRRAFWLWLETLEHEED